MHRSNQPILVALASAALTLLLHDHAAAQEPRTQADCRSEYTACFAVAGFFGYFFCPQRYVQCVDRVRSKLPTQITQTLDDVESCRKLGDVCRDKAGGEPDALGLCSRQQSVCIMDVLGVQPSPESAKNALCVQDAVSCVEASETNDDLARCVTSLRNCVMHPTEPL